jgi:hypothetical protein
VTQGAAWQRRLGIAGHIIALEFTWGDENGWHPAAAGGGDQRQSYRRGPFGAVTRS